MLAVMLIGPDPYPKRILVQSSISMRVPDAVYRDSGASGSLRSSAADHLMLHCRDRLVGALSV